jgi:YOP proteins translocation protein K (YscK)
MAQDARPNGSSIDVGGSQDRIKLHNQLAPDQGRWARALIQFNLEPVRYAHPSWLPEWAVQADLDSQTVLSLSKHLLVSQGVSQLFDWTLQLSAARLFLIPSHELANIALALGIASHRDRLRQVVRKEHILLLRKCTGEMLDVVWLPYAQTVPKSSDTLVFGWEKFEPAVLTAYLQMAGYSVLLSLLDKNQLNERPAAIRAGFCAPKHINQAALIQLPDSQKQTLLATIINIITPQQATAWTWLF